MKLMSLTAAGAVFLSGCSFQGLSGPPHSNSNLCIPEQYALAVGEGNTLAPGYNWQNGTYNTSLLIDAEKMAQMVPGYEAKARTGGQAEEQPLYVMFVPRSETQQPVPDAPSELTQLKGPSQLVRTDSDSQTWQVLQTSGGEQAHWGRCTNLFAQPDSFTCRRDLAVHDLGLTYTLHEDNLHLYPAIDELLRRKLDQWQCDSGESTN